MFSPNDPAQEFGVLGAKQRQVRTPVAGQPPHGISLAGYLIPDNSMHEYRILEVYVACRLVLNADGNGRSREKSFK